VIPVCIHDLLDLAFDVRGQVGQYGRGGLSFHERFAVYGSAYRVGREEKSPGDLLLPVAHDVQHGAAALGQAFEHVAFPADRRHDQRGLEGRLGDPGYRGCAGDGGRSRAMSAVAHAIAIDAFSQ